MSDYTKKQISQVLTKAIEKGNSEFSAEITRYKGAFDRITPSVILSQMKAACYDILRHAGVISGVITFVAEHAADGKLAGVRLKQNEAEIIWLSRDDIVALIYAGEATGIDLSKNLNADVQVTINILDSVFYWGKDVAKGQPVVELRACLAEPYHLRGEQSIPVPVGLSCRHDNPGFIGMVVPAGPLVGNPYAGITGTPHVIPSGTEVELRVMVQNHSDVDHGEMVTIKPGDVLAHLIYLPIAAPNFTLGTVKESENPQSKWEGLRYKLETPAFALMGSINKDIAALPEYTPVEEKLTESEINSAITWIQSRIAHHLAGAESPVTEVVIEGAREYPNVNFECGGWGHMLSFGPAEVSRIVAAQKEPVKEVEGTVDNLSEQQHYFLKVMHSFKLKGPQKENFFEPATAAQLKMPEKRGPESQNGRLAIMLTQQLEGTPVEKIEAKITPWILHQADLETFSEGMEILMAALGFKGDFRVSIPEIMSDEEDVNIKVPCPITVAVPGGGVLFDQKRFNWFMAVIRRYDEETYGQG